MTDKARGQIEQSPWGWLPGPDEKPDFETCEWCGEEYEPEDGPSSCCETCTERLNDEL